MNSSVHTIEWPRNGDDITLFFTDEDIFLTGVRAIISGGDPPPAVLVQIRYGKDRSRADGQLAHFRVSGGVDKVEPDLIGDVNIPSKSFVWTEIYQIDGEASQLNLKLEWDKGKTAIRRATPMPTVNRRAAIQHTREKYARRNCS